MPPSISQTVLSFSRRRRKWILLAAAAGLSGYGAYRIYHLPSLCAKRRKLAMLFGALVSLAEAVSSTADSICLVSADLNRFLRSDSDDIPLSIQQIAKIARSHEFSSSISTVSEAMTVGFIRGLRSSSDSPGAEAQTSSTFSDRLLEKLFSNKGSGFASVVVGSFARNMVVALCSSGEAMDSSHVPVWLTFMCSNNECRELIADSIQLFVRTAVSVYLEKTMEVNTYEDLFSGLTNPRHEAQVKDLLVSVCNGAVETLVKTSHEVLTSSNSTSSGGELIKQVCSPQNLLDSTDVKIKDGTGWVDRVSSVLAIPSNRQFVLDVTGRLTFESVRSFLEFVMWKIQDGVKRGVNVVHEEVIERGLDVMRFLSAKVVFTFSFCFALCMSIASGPRLLVPA